MTSISADGDRMGHAPPAVDSWVAGILAGERRAIGRALSEVENDTRLGQEILLALRERLGRAHVIGITGPGGAGKSTLVNALVRELRARGQSIGIVAVDPSSPISGGALLGDRIRMLEHFAAEAVFIRSLAARGHQGGLSLSASRVVDILDAAGMDTVIVETLGAGQAEVDICAVADTNLAVCPPGLGDEVQSMKAGILEMADVLVVNKADLPSVDQLEQSLLRTLALRPRQAWAVPVVRTVATIGEGVGALVDVLGAHRAAFGCGLRHRRAGLDRRSRLLHLAGDACRRWIMRDDDAEINELCDAFQADEIAQEEALTRMFALLAKRLSAER